MASLRAFLPIAACCLLLSGRGTTFGQAAEHGSFSLRCPALAGDGTLPVEFTGDGAGISPPLEWRGAPAGTRSFAVIMHHVDPEGIAKWYWTLYNIPPEVRSLPKDAHGIGVQGNNSVSRRVGYAPPHSKGPGAKTYIISAYALSALLELAVPPAAVNREVLLAAMAGHVLAQTEIAVVYTRPGEAGRRGNPGREAGSPKGQKSDAAGNSK